MQLSFSSVIIKKSLWMNLIESPNDRDGLFSSSD